MYHRKTSLALNESLERRIKMKIHIKTKRLIIRDFTELDADGVFELDADSEVHTYLGNNPIKTIEEAKGNIAFIRKQYLDNGIGRWAVIEKESGEFIGWTGFKWITDPINGKSQYYDLGYRFIKRAWGKGYATETAIASVNYGFNELKQEELFAMSDVKNLASNHILQKIGMIKIDEFLYENVPHNFYRIEKVDWQERL